MRLRSATILLLVASSGLAQPAINPLTPPTGRSPDCTTSGCHSEQMSKPFLHGPNAVAACEMCHEYKDMASHRFALKHEGRALCDFCHMDKSGNEGPIVHDPVAKGQCTACHDPHGAGNRKMLKGESGPQLCTECHKEALSGAHVHKPVGENCTTCHTPHAGSHQKLLMMEPKELCVSCHEDVAHTTMTASFPHEPAQDCLQCHSPHSSNEIKALRCSPKDLCASCHNQVTQAADSAAHKHGAVHDERSCLNCHTAHGSEHPKQLEADPVASCLRCHSKPIIVSKERTIAGVPELSIDANHRHGPIAEGRCVECHDVHGGAGDRLLVKPYATAFYQPYKEESVSLCLSCHDGSLVASEVASENQTGFRNGTRNLHYLHVSKGTQGRSCSACHTSHASRFEQLIADTVRYGEWNLPINFKPTSTGGSCAPGCHKVETYDRTATATPSSADVKLPPAAPRK